ncbi:hypothetical protein, partial [Novosphingobium sp. MBES04]|uniref:hypothetical protein n=1 Tax=Novosphingobium sp. MBES04 TaxID=1206458 RepID=UPI001A7EB341
SRPALAIYLVIFEYGSILKIASRRLRRNLIAAQIAAPPSLHASWLRRLGCARLRAFTRI